MAWAVALQGTRTRPPIPAPPSLRPFLRFQKLPTPALGPVRRVVDTDEAFRRRVASIATEELTGRAGFLWLARPEGWEVELERVALDHAAASEADLNERAERDARKRVDAAEHAARSALAEAAAATVALAAERARREAAEAGVAGLERRVQQLDIELAGARRRLDEAAVAASSARAVADGWRSEADDAKAQLEVAREAGIEALAEVATLTARLAGSEPTDAPDGVALSALSAEHPTELTSAAAALRDAAAASSLVPAGEGAASTSGTGGGGDLAVRRSRRRSGMGRTGARRRPLALPGGVLGGSLEAAEHLLRRPGAVVLVDGYNVAKLGWPDQPLPEQRTRLLDALDELVARAGTDVHVVFDGAAVGTLPIGRRHLRVTFSEAGVTADEVIVARVRSLPASRPVVVVTNDGEVRRACERLGANLVASDQLLAVARRG